jgi:hypothetical protein
LQLLINKITDNSIYKHANSCGTFLTGSEAKLTRDIGLACEITIVCPQFIQDTREQLSCHPVVAQEFLRIMDWLGRLKVVPIQLVVALFTVALDIGRAP